MKLSDLTPSQRRVMLATAAGWKPCESCASNGYKGQWRYPSDDGCTDVLPDYAADLNACHQLEAGLTDEEHDSFRRLLKVVVAGKDRHIMSCRMKREYVSATAHQRASALILTLVEGIEL